jgi:hypothetical protein
MTGLGERMLEMIERDIKPARERLKSRLSRE